MKIIVTGGAGFLGTQLIHELLRRTDHGVAPLTFDSITAVDLVESPINDPRVTSVVGDLSDPTFTAAVVDDETVAIYHLAAVLSGGSAENFDLAMAVNIDGTRNLLEAARGLHRAPRFIFTSSLAVFGGTMPELVAPDFATQPDSTYGATKAIGEILVNEYSRKGFIDGRICRLPTISVRPGAPNSAASSFASGIVREPLNGVESVCPVPHTTPMWLSSPRTVVANLVHALELSSEHLDNWRGLNLPGITVTVGEMLAALERVAGTKTRSLVRDELSQPIMDIVCSWPGAFDVESTLSLGFVQDQSFDEVIRQYREDYLSPAA